GKLEALFGRLCAAAGVIEGAARPEETGRSIGEREKAVMDVMEISKILPHRYPFLLVDRVLEYTPGEKLTGYKNVTLNEPFFGGHFPGHPVMPGVLILEALAQA